MKLEYCFQLKLWGSKLLHKVNLLYQILRKTSHTLGNWHNSFCAAICLLFNDSAFLHEMILIVG